VLPQRAAERFRRPLGFTAKELPFGTDSITWEFGFSRADYVAVPNASGHGWVAHPPDTIAGTRDNVVDGQRKMRRRRRFDRVDRSLPRAQRPGEAQLVVVRVVDVEIAFTPRGVGRCALRNQPGL